MRNALLGGTLVALAAGLIGYFIVVRSSAFAAHALAHIGFPGATGAVLLGLPVTLGLAVFCIGGALVIGALGKRADEREVATGTVLAAATGLGLFFSSLATRSSSTVTNVLFGNLLAMTHQQLVIFAVRGRGARGRRSRSSTARCCSRRSIPQVAEAKGVPVRVLSVIFMALLGLAVTMAVQAVGHAAAVRAGRHPGRDGHHADGATGRWRWRFRPGWRWSRSGPAWRCRRCSTCRRAS